MSRGYLHKNTPRGIMDSWIPGFQIILSTRSDGKRVRRSQSDGYSVQCSHGAPSPCRRRENGNAAGNASTERGGYRAIADVRRSRSDGDSIQCSHGAPSPCRRRESGNATETPRQSEAATEQSRTFVAHRTRAPEFDVRLTVVVRTRVQTRRSPAFQNKL